MERYNINMQETAPRPPINRPPPAPSTNEDLPRQTPCLQVPGYHHDFVAQGSGPGFHTTDSYPNRTTTTRRHRSPAIELHRGVRIERIGALSQLDPLRGSAYIPLLRWIQTRKAVANVTVTNDMHPVETNAHRRVKYVEHMDKYDFSSLFFPVPLQAVGPFPLRNNMSINVYGVDDDNDVIYPLSVSSTLVSDRHVDLLLFEHDGVQHYTTIRDFSRLVGRHLNNHGHTHHCCRRCLHAYSSQALLDAHALDCCHAQRTKFPQ